MTITITDPSLLAQLKSIVPGAILCGPNGEILAELSRPYGMPPPGHVPPISDEEIARRRELEKDGEEFSLDEVWQEIRRRHP